MFKYPKNFDLYYEFDFICQYVDVIRINNEFEELELFFNLKKQNKILKKTTKGQFIITQTLENDK